MKRITPLCNTALALVVLIASGCASPPPKSYVVLLPNPDGSVGQVVVRGNKGEQLLTEAQHGVALDGGTSAFPVDEKQLDRDFGAARAALPLVPEQFLLYFDGGGVNLTSDSKDLLPRILERIKVRGSVDMSVIGHTDTQGKADANEILALKRATAIAEQFRQLGLQDVVISLQSHGERNLLVMTPDETSEPRNRRVEITLR